MRSIAIALSFSVFFLFQLRYVKAQDTVIILGKADLESVGTIDLGKHEGWYFHPGNDNAWSDIGLSMEGWKRMKFKELNRLYLDQNGLQEGWFRIRFMLDSTIRDSLWRFSYQPLTAAEFYIDGKPWREYGRVGKGVSGFEYFLSVDSTMRIDLRSGRVYSMAVHIKDKLVRPSNVTGSMLSSEMAWLKDGFVKFYSDEQFYAILDLRADLSIYYTLWIMVNGLIALLFLLLYVLNPKDYTLFLCAGVCLFLSLNNLLSVLVNYGGHYNFQPGTILLFMTLFHFTYFLFTLFMLFTIVRILDIRLLGLNKWLLFLIVFLATLNLIQDLVTIYGHSATRFQIIPDFVAPVIILIVFVYWVIISFRKANDSQRSVAIGVLLLLAFLIGLVLLPKGASVFVFHRLVTALLLCFPLSLLVYVSLRFREINNNILLNAQQVVDLSNEKRIMAEMQQRELEEQVQKRTLELRNSLEDLRITQKQLVHAEKMASLGELTAGIAHEIQNPLNFVNNFAEVNTELIDELKKEVEPSGIKNARELIDDIKANSEKITFHGKRADAIVKSMLQHSRKSSGKKELTDINGLCDECLRLSYHGLRAKDKSFNAEFETKYDASLPLVQVEPQDIGRVVLNLINNAFYAVNEREKKEKDGRYKPQVTLTTRREGDQVVIKVADNGIGIPIPLREKIFQPFFTTKPTGEGTGLGLSLSYDIVQAHQGRISINAPESGGTEFIVSIPMITQ
jgi:two-component system NtrC family sensor kinase